MNIPANAFATRTPFHAGELEIQTRTGRREMMEKFASRAISSVMPDQHRDFYTQLPFMVVGSVDEDGWPWASILPGLPGFMHSPEPTLLYVKASAVTGDPLGTAMGKVDSPLGLLGIEMETRRRNRMNGRIAETRADGFTVKVDQAFGNCPQYIQTRNIEFVREPGTVGQSNEVISFNVLDEAARKMIRTADTFFVSSFLQSESQPDIEGVDVSHRGGRPGFVKVEGDTLTIPDYTGNYLFNTLGNFLLNPKAGLVFTDFSSGDLLMLTGRVEILWEDEPEVKAFKGAERAWRFTLDHGLRLKDALPFRAHFGKYAPTTLINGEWEQANAVLSAEAKRDVWRPYRVMRTEDESSLIRSFYLEPNDGEGLLPFKAGQSLTIQITPKGVEKPIIRTYTVSSAPGDPYYRISVKHEQDGLISKYLHSALKVGDVLEAKAPGGQYFIDASEQRPAVLLAGGVGITPMISMASHIANEGIRTRHTRALTIFHAAQTTEQRAFTNAFRKLQQQTAGVVRYYTFIDQPEKEDKLGIDYNGVGYITADALRQTLALDDYDFYLCGPPSFMQSIYDTLRGLGVRDRRIFAEAFGPASLSRKTDEGTTPTVVHDEAEESVIKFSRSGFEQSWKKGESTILEIAEQHGLSPEFGCRNGACGSCAVKITSGSVAYRNQPSASLKHDEALICSAVPAKGTDVLEVEL